MALPASEERVLHRMEISLRTHEPRLAAIFAVFTRLTKDEEIPQTERMAPQPWLPWHRLHRSASGGRVPSGRRRPRRVGRQAGAGLDQPWSRFAHTPRVLMVVLVTWFVVISVSIAVGVSSRRSCGQPAAGLAAAAQARALALGARWTLTGRNWCRAPADAGTHP